MLSRGKLVFERSASARVRFQVKTAGLYADLIPMFETHIRYLKQPYARAESLVDRHVVRARIAKIRRYVALLRKIRRLADESAFVKEPLVYGNAERYLQCVGRRVRISSKP